MEALEAKERHALVIRAYVAEELINSVDLFVAIHYFTKGKGQRSDLPDISEKDWQELDRRYAEGAVL